MKILSVSSIEIPGIKVIRFGRFSDLRGYFTEPFRKSVFFNHPDLKECMDGIEFVQTNESFSKKGVIRGLHFQWNPYMFKLVRTVSGHMLDLFLDIRKGSPTFGKIMAYDMPTSTDAAYGEWIWVPAGFAHGNLFFEDTRIEYFCSGEYSQGCEAGISPLAPDLDWSLCDPALKGIFDSVVAGDSLMTDKDRNGLSLAQWVADERSNNFIYGVCDKPGRG